MTDEERIAARIDALSRSPRFTGEALVRVWVRVCRREVARTPDAPLRGRNNSLPAYFQIPPPAGITSRRSNK
jgi:hypothetical protein